MNENQIEGLTNALHTISKSITPLDALPARLPSGVQVGCLTEAVLAIATSLDNVASAIRQHADETA